MEQSTTMSISNDIFQATKKKLQMDDLEEALDICGFGLFQIKLLAACLSTCFACNMMISHTAYIVPNAECDLNLTLEKKGWLAGAPYMGLVLGSVPAGVASDTFGRKPFLFSGNTAFFMFYILEGLSQNFTFMFIFKIFQGLFGCLIFTASLSMLSECTHKRARNRVTLANIIFLAFSTLVSALIAWSILPTPVHIEIITNVFVIRSWNILILVNSVWSGFAAVLFYSIPESPKYLLSQGLNKQSLEVLKYIYHMNKKQDPESFPMKHLETHFEFEHLSFEKRLIKGIVNSKTLLKPPMVYNVALLSGMIFITFAASSALRAWYPQISTIIENYKIHHNDDTSYFCEMVDDYIKKPKMIKFMKLGNTTVGVCVPRKSGPKTYLNGVILGTITTLFTIAVTLIVEHVKMQPLILILHVLSAILTILIFRITSFLWIALICSILIGFVHASFGLLSTFTSNLFPTDIRASSLSLVLMIGRIGASLASIIFPVLLKKGCTVVFGLLCATLIVVAIASVFLPKQVTIERAAPVVSQPDE